LRRAFWHASYAPAFFRELGKLKPRLVHAHFALDGAAALPISAALNIPLIVSLHGYDVSSSDKWLARSPEGRVYLRRRAELWARASSFLCISDFIRQKALAQGFPAEKLHVHYTGANMRLFRLQTTERDRNMILFVGRLVEKKGVHHLLDALTEVRRRHPAAHLVLIGGGPLETELRQRVAAEALPCTFLGVQPTDVVKRYLSRARVFSVPSITASTGDSEGLGMVFIEAQAMGTPVASFNHGGISEAVTHRRTGLLADEGDSKGLAANLLRLLRDDVLHTELTRNCRREVYERFDIVRQTAKLEEIYAQVVAAHSPR
jgi:colanic acid/amylovoran biosynthesis glycosyltransferase